MLTQWIKASGASFLLIVATLAVFEPAGAARAVASDREGHQIA